MKKHSGNNFIPILAALLLFALFSVCVLSVLLGGAGVYRRLTQRDAHSYESYTGGQFLAVKLRQTALAEQVKPAQFGDGDALELYRQIDGDTYITRLYCHDGWLMELFTLTSGEFEPQDGERILPAEQLQVEQEQDLLRLTLTCADGTKTTRCFSLETGEVRP